MADEDATRRWCSPTPARGRMGRAWVAALTAIPLSSIFGRPLQSWVLATWGRDGLALSLALLFVAAGAAFVARAGRGIPQAALISGLLLLVFTAIIQGVPTVEERMHFLLFGALAYSGGLALGLLRGLAIVVGMAFADEGLQWLLPDRHGDLRDVGMNLLGGSIGLALVCAGAWLGRNAGNPHRKR